MSDQEKGPEAVLYPELGKTERQPVKPRPEGGTGLSNAEAGAVLYPERDNRFPAAPGGQLNVVLRNIHGAIIEEAPFGNDPLDMAARRNNRLGDADLEGFNFKGKSLNSSRMRNANLKGTSFEDGSLHDSDLAGASLEGAILRGCNLARVDLRGASFDAATDISQADFDSAWIDAETYQRLTACKGFHQARNLKVRSDA